VTGVLTTGMDTAAKLEFRLYVGAPEPAWLSRAGFPLFVSRNRLIRQKKVKPAIASWAMDSGGFSELQQHGQWTIGPRQFVDEVRRWRNMIGNLDWVACQDWMCEPMVINGGTFKGVTFKGTGLSVAEHQRRTILSYLGLRDMAPEIWWAPVLQGWEPDDYWRHVEMYANYGVDLRECGVVGVGSVCRRQGTGVMEPTIAELHRYGLRMHGFGFKKTGLLQIWRYFASSDSMAWSEHVRKNNKKLGSCTHADCRNCICGAQAWREELYQELFKTSCICPECGSYDVLDESHDAFYRCCTACGHAWARFYNNKTNGFDYTPLTYDHFFK
jgi:hypothetical protein